MITPLDIQNKEFGKAVRGYKEEEVDMFLDMVTLDFEKVIKENAKLKAQVHALEADIERYQGSEGEVIKVLEQAQQLMGDISISAEKRAEILLKNAELDAELTVREARVRAERLREENISLEKRYTAFRDKYHKMLEDEIYRFENLNSDIFVDLDNGDKLEMLINEPLVKTANIQRGFDDRATGVLEELEKEIMGEEAATEEDDKFKTRVDLPKKENKD